MLHVGDLLYKQFEIPYDLVDDGNGEYYLEAKLYIDQAFLPLYVNLEDRMAAIYPKPAFYIGTPVDYLRTQTYDFNAGDAVYNELGNLVRVPTAINELYSNAVFRNTGFADSLMIPPGQYYFYHHVSNDQAIHITGADNDKATRIPMVLTTLLKP